MKKAYDFFEKWILENVDNVCGKQVNEVYYTYSAQAFKAGYRAYGKKRFIEEVKYELGCLTREYFIEVKDVYSIENKEEY